MDGTTSEAVMGNVTKVVTNDNLHGIFWHVVLVYDANVIL